MNRAVLLFLAGAIGLAGRAAFAEEGPALSKKELAPLVEQELALPKEALEIGRKASSWKSYRAEFALEAKEERGGLFKLRGVLLFKQPNLRRLEIWEGDSVEPTQILVSDGKVEWQYHPQNAVVYRLAEPVTPPGPHRPFGEAQPGTVRFIERAGEAGQGRLRFEAEPIPAAVEAYASAIQKLRIEVSEEDGLARELLLLDPDGNTVLTQRFTKVEVNVPTDATGFSFVPTEGVAVIDVPRPEPVEAKEP